LYDDGFKSSEYRDAFIKFLKEDCHIRNPLSAKVDEDNEILREFIGQEYWNVAKMLNFCSKFLKI
jgi:hypothetical protein